LDFRLRKSQVAMEFVMLIMLAFMIMVVFSVFARDKVVDLRQEEEFASLKDVALAVQSEISIATSVENGYSRDFALPVFLNGINYSITISSGYILAESENYEYAVKASPVSGNIAKGLNTISKEGGVVYLIQ